MDRTRFILGPDGSLYGTGDFLRANGAPVRMDALDASIQAAMIGSLTQMMLDRLDSDEPIDPPMLAMIGQQIAQN